MVERRTFEDLLEDVGTKGVRNYIIFFCACIGGWLTGMHSFAYQFLGATPDYWCNVPELTNTNWTTEQIKYIAIPATIQNGKRLYYKCDMYAMNYSELALLSWNEAVIAATKALDGTNETVHCYKRHFDSDVETVVTKWDLVCERRVLYSTTQAAVQGGMLIGFISSGWLADKYGRSYIYKRCLILYIIFEVCTLLSASVEMFIFMRVVTALMGAGFYLTGFLISVELCSTKQRSSVANYYVIPWSLGMMTVATYSYFIHPWWQLQIALFVPSFLLIPNIWILPESPRWLILQGRYEEAYKILKNIADSNGNSLSNKQEVIEDMQQMQIMMRSEEEIADIAASKTIPQRIFNTIRHVLSLLLDETVRWRTICVFVIFFVTAFIYFGVSLADPSITTDNSLYLLIAGALEVPSYLILWPSVSYLGRKKSLICFFMASGLSIILAMVLQLVDHESDFYALKLILFLVGKFAITAAFHLMWVFTAELYPTKYRSLAVGEGTSVARIGSFFSSYVKDLLGAKAMWSPAALFGGCAFIAGGMIISLPETTNQNLPEAVSLAKEEEDRPQHIPAL